MQSFCMRLCKQSYDLLLHFVGKKLKKATSCLDSLIQTLENVCENSKVAVSPANEGLRKLSNFQKFLMKTRAIFYL